MMTIEEKRKWLGSYSQISREIDALCEERERISSMIYKFTNIDKSTLKGAVDMLREIVVSLNDRVAILVDKRKSIIAAIESVADEKYRELLYFRYIMGMTYEEIALRLDRERRWIFRLFKKALLEINIPQGEWIWNEECECWCCSRCEASALNNYRGLSVDSNFCPNCGARMKGAD